MITAAITLKRPDFELDVEIRTGPGITALFGPSGSGKSSILRVLAGLEPKAKATIQFGDTMIQESGAALPPQARRIGYVFQEAALFPHLTVAGNLRYARLFRKEARDDAREAEVINVLGIGHLLKRRPGSLSGGERQRVAIGRAFLSAPRLLLLDEPLAALDQARKLEIMVLIERLRDQFALPMLYVSHSREEVLRLADHVITLEAGRVVAMGAPADILR